MMDDDNETMVNVANAMFTVFSVKAPKLIAKTDDFDRVIQRYLETEDTDTLGKIKNMKLNRSRHKNIIYNLLNFVFVARCVISSIACELHAVCLDLITTVVCTL